MDPVFIAMLTKYGIDAVIQIVDSWKASGNPTPEQIRAAFIDKQPEEYFNK